MTYRIKLSLYFAAMGLLFVCLSVMPVRRLFEPVDQFQAESTAREDALAVLESGVGADNLIVARPLFDASRQPPKALQQPKVAREEGPPLVPPTLEGTMRTRDGNMLAYFRFEGESETKRLTSGDEYSGWRIDRIAEGSAIVSKSGKSVELALDNN